MHLAFGSALILLLLSGLAAYDTAVRLRNAQRWVTRSRDVQSTLCDINSISSRAGRARTRYIDSGDDSFLQDYQLAASQIPSRLTQLRRLTTDNVSQQNSWTQLEDITNRRLGLLNKSVQLKRSGAPDVQQQAQLRQEIIDVSAEADSLLQRMEDEEQRLLDERTRQSERLFRATVYVLCGAFFVALALLFLHYRLLNAELQAREQAELSLRNLSARLLELQDQERRKFSRELHDSLGQYLAGVKMNLSMLRNSVPANTLISESIKLLDQAITETRTISHLLHPPLLDETGFESAAKWYVEGFAKRSGIQTGLDIPENLGRLPSSLELALFRVLQESLTNVHRHSKSPRASVSLELSDNQIALRVKDYGKGIPADVLSLFQRNRLHAGVGLAGMRERIHELGGRLEMNSDGRGTEIIAIMPRPSRTGSVEVTAAG
jgi:signal transduction histidine kinase